MTAPLDASTYVQERFAAVLVWERNLSGTFALNPNRSSASSLSFMEYAHASRGYLFAVGTGLIGRAASLPVGGMLCLELTPETPTTEYQRIVEAHAAGAKASLALHSHELVVMEFISAAEERDQEDNEQDVLRAFAREFWEDCKGTSSSAIVAAHTLLRRQQAEAGTIPSAASQEADDRNHPASPSCTTRTNDASFAQLCALGSPYQAFTGTDTWSLSEADSMQAAVQVLRPLVPATTRSRIAPSARTVTCTTASCSGLASPVPSNSSVPEFSSLLSLAEDPTTRLPRTQLVEEPTF